MKTDVNTKIYAVFSTLVLVLTLASCFSPWESSDKEGTLTINLGGGGGGITDRLFILLIMKPSQN